MCTEWRAELLLDSLALRQVVRSGKPLVPPGVIVDVGARQAAAQVARQQCVALQRQVQSAYQMFSQRLGIIKSMGCYAHYHEPCNCRNGVAAHIAQPLAGRWGTYVLCGSPTCATA